MGHSADLNGRRSIEVPSPTPPRRHRQSQAPRTAPTRASPTVQGPADPLRGRLDGLLLKCPYFSSLLARAASAEQTAAHDTQTAEAARYKLSPISADDPDGYHRAACPALAGRLRCPHRPESLTLSYDRPTITTPPEHPPACCTQKTVTVPPSANAKTRQKHDYPGARWRASYARRSGAERANSTLKDPATNTIERGWTRLAGLVPILLYLTATTAVRNLRVTDAFEARAADNARRAADGLPPRTRRSRRKTLTQLAGAANAPP
jgi:hypothetical protein